MNIVFLTQQLLLRLCNRLFRHTLANSKPAVHASRDIQSSCEIATKNITNYALLARAESSFSLSPPIKPLRIVRVVETGQTHTSVGRMVISGRMADVCAELDRLAACEAAMT
jgi:hypothetical protein